MATKDWKMYQNGQFGTDWFSVNDKYSYVKVWKTGLSLGEMKRRGKIGTYIFATRKGLRGRTIKKYFKTKTEALKFARAYMRKH